MANDGNVQFHSADIGKKPQEQLLKNVTQKTAAQKFFSDRDKVKSLITGIIALLCVVMLGVVALVAYGPWKDIVGEDNISWQQRVYNISREMYDITLETPLDEYVAAAERLDTYIAEAENESMRFQLNLIKADLLIRNSKETLAIDDVIVPELDATTDVSRRFELYRLAVIAFSQTGDREEQLDFIQRILILPDEAFTNFTDDTWRQYFIQLEQELQS